MAVHEDLLFEPPSFGGLLLHVRSREVPVDQCGFTGAHGAQDTHPQIGHRASNRPLLAVHERICKGKISIIINNNKKINILKGNRKLDH